MCYRDPTKIYDEKEVLVFLPMPLSLECGIAYKHEVSLCLLALLVDPDHILPFSLLRLFKFFTLIKTRFLITSSDRQYFKFVKYIKYHFLHE